VSLHGFGPFHETVTYPLYNRGLVLLRGYNKDGGSDSNGSGKTSLVMSILWAFTGTVDPRPLQDSKAVDVINDASKSATVTIDGALNGIKFSITRTKTSTRGTLSFFFDNADLTRQSIKDTQDMINEKLGINPQVLVRTVFNGQHALNELLDASDTKLKDELSLVVPLSIWQDALLLSRQKLRDLGKRISELDGMISVRSDDVVKMKMRLEEAKSRYEAELSNHEYSRILLESEIESLSNLEDDNCIVDLKVLEDNALVATNSIRDIEHELELVHEQSSRDLSEYEKSINSMKAQASTLHIELQSLAAERNKMALDEALSKDRITRLQEMWNLDFSRGVPNPFVLPQNCPTCQQPILSRNLTDKHAQLESTVRDSVEESLAQLSDARSRLLYIQDAIMETNATKFALENNITDARNVVINKRRMWDDAVKRIESRLHDARQLQQQASFAVTETAKKLNEQSKVASLRTKISASKDLLDQAAQSVDRAQTEWTEYERLVEELNNERSKLVVMSRLMADLCDAFGTRGIQSFVMQGAVSALETAAQTYLDELSDGAQRLQLTLDANDSIVRRAYVRGEKSIYKERALASLSGGQWRRCSLAFTLAFADLVANRANFRPSLIVLDEPLMHLDQSGRSNVGRLLRKLLRREAEQKIYCPAGLQISTILIILQDLAAEELEESFDAIDEVVKENGASTVFVDQ
jgi:DNA repair exonuclease SbcCD ATPase subunit